MVPDWPAIVQNGQRNEHQMASMMRTVCEHIWNSLNTLLGCVGAWGGQWTGRPDEQICEVTGGWLTAELQRLGWADAITLGDVVLYADQSLPLILRAHEMVHVRQGRLWGPLFLPAYGLESLWQWLRTGEGYRNNRFERAAYAVSVL